MTHNTTETQTAYNPGDAVLDKIAYLKDRIEEYTARATVAGYDNELEKMCGYNNVVIRSLDELVQVKKMIKGD